MNNIIQVLKKIGLFLFGILLIIWGYKVNAANNEEKTKAERESNNKEIGQQPVNVPADNNPAEQDTLKTEIKKVVTPKANDKKAVPQAKPKVSAPTPAKSPESTVEKKTESKVVEEPVKVEEPKQTVIEKETPEESSGTE